VTDLSVLILGEPIQRDDLPPLTHAVRLESDGAASILALTFDPTGDAAALSVARDELTKAIEALREEHQS
jgi:hypothetical protein